VGCRIVETRGGEKTFSEIRRENSESEDVGKETSHSTSLPRKDDRRTLQIWREGSASNRKGAGLASAEKRRGPAGKKKTKENTWGSGRIRLSVERHVIAEVRARGKLKLLLGGDEQL